MFRGFLSALGKQTSVVIILRKIVELNFYKQKAAIRQYLTLKPGERVIDVGCGTGEFAALFPMAQYEGIDIDPANIAYAKRHYPHHFQIGDALKLPFPNGSFDAALVVGVLHHLSDEEAKRTLAEVRRVLKPTGKGLIMEDTQTKRFVSRMMHRMDQGAYIRSAEEWNTLMSLFFKIEKTWTFTLGVGFYSSFLLTYGN